MIYLRPELKRSFLFGFTLIFTALFSSLFGQSFNPSGLVGENNTNPTSLVFGPDSKLYVAQQDGIIQAYTVERDNAPAGSGTYTATATETITSIKNGVPNYNDDGTASSINARQVTGIFAAGTSVNPVLYVSSSDSRIGGQASGTDTNLDTNSGVLSKLTWNGSSWERIDLVRGLPRCEENHSTNGMDTFELNGNTYLLLQQGGNTNMGAPSNNFAGTSETYLSAALLIINLSQLEGMPVYTDPRSGSEYVYDLPTLNDPERQDITNVSPDFPYPAGHPMYNATIDIGDPFGGNNGLNQAVTEAGGPVQIFSPGFRNAYDVVITSDGRIYSSDNGGNANWGGTPVIYTSGGTVKSDQSNYDPGAGDYVTNDFNENNTATTADGLHFLGFVTDDNGTYYAGHPVPIRAFPDKAGVKSYTYNGSTWVETGDYEFANLLSNVRGYFDSSLDISDFPQDTRQGAFKSGETADPELTILDMVNSSTNGITEYTASNFGGAMQGDLLTASFNGKINRYQLNASGDALLSKDNNFLSGFGSQPLDVIAQGDGDPFPGTIWAVTYGANDITVFEPTDFGACPQPGDQDYDPLADSDGDGYSNGDEVDNGTNHCSAGSKPADYDQDLISDLNDPDDDNDGINDVNDVFAIDANNGLTTSLPISYPFWNNDPGTGLFGLGFTGLMLDPSGNTDYLDQYDENNLSFGGAGGKATIDVVGSGSASGLTNTQDDAFQFGIAVDENSPAFTVHAEVENPFSGNEALTGQSQGIFIGTGDQDNYLKVVVMEGTTSGDGINGFQVVLESNGIVLSSDITDIAGLAGITATDIYISVDPAAGTAQPFYSVNGGENVMALGSPVSIPTSFLDAGDAKGLAVGLIATAGNAPGFTATWDFMNVRENAPATLVATPNPMDFGGTGVNAQPIQLNLVFENTGDPVAGNLTISNEELTGTHAALFSTNTATPIIIGPGATKTVQVTFTPDGNEGAKDAELIYTHDGSNTPLSVPLSGVLTDIITLSRVNAGGDLVNANDGNNDWEANSTTGATSGPTYSVNTGNITTSGLLYENRDISIPSYINEAVFNELFAEERFDTANGEEMEFSFALPDGLYIVNLYFGNSFSGTNQVGDRVFDIVMENSVVRNNFDIIAEFGDQSGGMIAIPVPVSDGELNIQFLHEIQNPLINAIEIIDGSNQDIAFNIFPIPDEENVDGQEVSIQATAYGGDSNDPVTYSISGQPQGVNIDPNSGLITGKIEISALNGGPGNDGVHQVTVTASKPGESDVQTTFTWTITEFESLRINAGGTTVVASDNLSNWKENPVGGAYQGDGYFVNVGNIVESNLLYSDKHSSIPSYIDEATFNAIFQEERYDIAAGAEMQFDIPVSDGNYTVNLYLGNSFSGTNQVGDRVFDIEIEDILVRDDLDLIAEFGHESGGMLSFPVEVSDGEINIQFLHEVENPLINAIEILVDNSQYPPIVVDPIADQNSKVGDTAELAVVASGGNPDANFNYAISGQPEGIDIESTNGQIFGTIAPGAESGGPSNNGVHNVVVTVSKPGSATVQTTFTWTVGLSWSLKNEDQTYTARHENAFIQAGDKFYLMGGRESAQTIDIYDYSTDTWTSLVDSAPFEFNHFQAVVHEGLIWVIGAFKTNNFPNEEPTEYVWSFNPATQEWVQGPEIPVSRRRGSAAVVFANGLFYIMGGNANGHAGGFVPWTDTFNPETGEWTVLPDAPRARDHFGASILGDKVYVAGGRQSGGAGGVFKPTLPEVDVFDLTQQTWSTLPAGQNIPTPRGGSTSVTYDGKLYVIGGEVENETVYGQTVSDALAITEAYDPISASWERKADLNNKRHGTQAFVSGDGIWITAGSPNLAGGQQKNMEYLGADNPQGEASVASTLSAPDLIDVAADDTRDFKLNVSGGNVGVIVTSMDITGPDAADFYIASGELTNGLIPAEGEHTVTIGLNGAGAGRNAVLTINYGASSSIEVNLTSDNVAPVVENPGTQNNNEGDSVSLQIDATDASENLTYDATGLPPNLVIDPNTGLISGILTEGTTGDGSFKENNGLVVVEAESGTLEPTWTETTIGGATGIIAGSNHFGSQNGGTIPYQIEVTTPGVYRFNWRSFFSGSSSTDENDNWLRFPNNENVWFFGYQGNPGDEQTMINNLQGAQNNVVFPVGSGRESASTTPEGSSSNGYFKIYRAGGTSQTYDWQAYTSDNDAHNVYVYFVNPGTYTMEISERSAGHAIDRFALYKVDGPNYTGSQLTSFPESEQNSGTPGAAAGSPYTVEVTVTDDGNPVLASTEEFIWNVSESGNEAPQAVASANPQSGLAPLTVNFTGSNSTDDQGIITYFWDFKDAAGGSSNEADPTYVFNDPGIYAVELTVQDAGGLTSTDVVNIVVNNPDGNEAPIAAFTATPEEGEVPLEVFFDASASSDDVGIVTYSWDFGDGNTANGEITEHTYDTVGTFEATLTVTDTEGVEDSISVTITVNEPVNEAPVAIASATPENGTAPLEVSFVGSASTDDDAVVGYSWNFDDGSTSDLPDPVHTFTEAGTYEVSLTVIDAEGLEDSTTLTITVEEAPNDAPVAVISASPESGEVPLEVMFTGSNSTDDKEIVSYEWNFQDGSTSDIADPVHTFTAVGTFEVSLTVSDAEGLEDSATITIVVEQPANTAPTAVATATPTSGEVPLVVEFDGSASADDKGIESYSWDFGDGNSSTEVSPTHTYNSTGTFTATLTVTDAEGLEDSVSITIVVGDQPNNPPVAIVDATPRSGSAPLEVSFVGRNSTDDFGIVSYLWDFGDGTTSTEVDPVHTFTNEGVYLVQLTVEDEAGLTSTATITITVSSISEEGDLMGILLQNPVQDGTAWVRILNMPQEMDVQAIYLYDSGGKLVDSITQTGQVFSNDLNAFEIPVYGFRTGLYFISIEMDNGENLVVKLLVSN